MSFEDLLAANREYAQDFDCGNFDGIARAGVLIVTCMDSRIDPLRMIGLDHGDAKILRSPGGQVTTAMLVGCVLGVQLLNVNRIMIVPHTKCAMARGDDQAVKELIAQRTGADANWMSFGATTDQLARLRNDVMMVASHPLINGRAEVGGFSYDVDTGLLEQLL